MAFLREFKQSIKESNDDVDDDEAKSLAESYIRGCQIHYFRSVVRVARIQSAVPVVRIC